jgi:hypothetical protein
MNENRGLFALDGITGMLIATVLLLSILAGLTAWGIAVQQGSSDKFYYLENPKDIKMKSVDNVNHLKWK